MGGIMKRVGILLSVFVATVAIAGSVFNKEVVELCRGFLPENDMYISADVESVNGITEEVFQKVLDRVSEVYKPLVAEKGGNLVIIRDWTNGTVNAYASRSGSDYIIRMFGGLARHATVTPLGFAAVACHEIGHHIGGAPRYNRNTNWASTEGQSDYWAMLKCMRLFQDGLSEEQRAMFGMNDAVVEEFGQEKCDASFEDKAEREFCYQNVAAGQSLANLLATLGGAAMPKLTTPDPRVVTTVLESHPQAQCRLDTYFHGGLCTESVSADVDANDATVGTCNTSEGNTSGIRPLCWFKPAAL
jgi:hypothetical protein